VTMDDPAPWIHPTEPLVGERMTLRPLRFDDRDALHAAASDPRIWEQHPANDRHERPVFDRYFDVLLTAGGTLVAEEVSNGRVIGSSRFYLPPGQPGDVAIGFTFLTRDRWGGSWNREMKRLMLQYAIGRVVRIWFHVAPANVRSQVAVTRLGAVLDHKVDLDLGGGRSTMLCYRLNLENDGTKRG